MLLQQARLALQVPSMVQKFMLRMLWSAFEHIKSICPQLTALPKPNKIVVVAMQATWTQSYFFQPQRTSAQLRRA
jgi:hypothetical protein